MKRSILILFVSVLVPVLGSAQITLDSMERSVELTILGDHCDLVSGEESDDAIVFDRSLSLICGDYDSDAGHFSVSALAGDVFLLRGRMEFSYLRACQFDATGVVTMSASMDLTFAALEGCRYEILIYRPVEVVSVAFPDPNHGQHVELSYLDDGSTVELVGYQPGIIERSGLLERSGSYRMMVGLLALSEPSLLEGDTVLNYELWIYPPDHVSNEEASWSEIKSLYR